MIRAGHEIFYSRLLNRSAAEHKIESPFQRKIVQGMHQSMQVRASKGDHVLLAIVASLFALLTVGCGNEDTAG
jgi:hypothetical protein